MSSLRISPALHEEMDKREQSAKILKILSQQMKRSLEQEAANKDEIYRRFPDPERRELLESWIKSEDHKEGEAITPEEMNFMEQEADPYLKYRKLLMQGGEQNG